MLKTVVLPAPFGPIRPSKAPLRTVRSKSPTARRPPNCLVRPWISSTGSGNTAVEAELWDCVM